MTQQRQAQDLLAAQKQYGLSQTRLQILHAMVSPQRQSPLLP